MDQPTLETARLILRPFTLDDAPEVQRLAGAPEVARTTLNIRHPYPDGVAEDWIRHHGEYFAARKAVIYAITQRSDHVLCGSISLGIVGEHHRAELGYWLGVGFWGQGYATEAASALCEFGFRQLGLNRIQAHHFASNPASGRVMQKIGMEHEGLLRQHIWKNGVYEDLPCYAVLRETWLERHPGR